MTGTYAYDAFGPVRTHTGATTEWSYTGEQNDPSGLEYLRARYYDPALGRFITQDPLMGIMRLPLSQSRYPHVLNNPANLLDPSGLCVFGLPCPDPIENAGECIKNGGDCIRDPIAKGVGAVGGFLQGATYPYRAQITILLEKAFVGASRGNTRNKEGGVRLVTNCRGLCELVHASAFTIGHTVFTTQPDINPDTLAHEKRHVRQYEILGDAFWVVYGASGMASATACLAVATATGDFGDYGDCLHDTNILEILAR